MIRKLLIPALFALAFSTGLTPAAADPAPPTPVPHGPRDGRAVTKATPAPALAGRATAAAFTCVNGTANGYPCNKVDLMAQLPLNTIGGGQGNDIWGWTDPQTGKEYALVGRSSGTSFVDISNPSSPVYLGNLPTATSNSDWRDLEVYANRAYIVSEASGHGMQVFDLTRLRNVTSPPVTFTADARNTSFSTAHTISVNTQTGFAYVNGSNTCSGGPRMFNVANPGNPVFAGCLSGDGYTHDAQAVVYHGPDSRYQGHEILFNSNEDTLTLYDVTTKSSPVQLSRKTYAGAQYVHQGWLTEDHRYFLLNDELDEQRAGHNTWSYSWDMSSLTNPVLLGHYTGPTAAIDHNEYIKGNFAYQSNYTAGLRILDLTNVASPTAITEAAYFDVDPARSGATFNGTWANYPFFASGNVVVNSIERGLFVLKPNLSGGPPPTTVFADDFETAKGWTVNPNGTDTALTGSWERGDPQATSSGGTALQLGTTTSGSNDLVTGAAAGASVGANDVDGGLTSVQSPAIALPSSGTITLSFQQYLAHLNNAGTDDFLRVKVVAGTTTTVFQQAGSATNRPGAWAGGSADLSALAGQTIRILIEVADAGTGSLIEAGIDDLKITKQ